MSKEFKVIESNIQPNHKEAEIWATPTSNNGTKQLKYWNQKTQSWEGEGGGGGESAEAVKYVCVLHKPLTTSDNKALVGNCNFKNLKEGDQIMVVFAASYGEHVDGIYTFKSCI